ncbi:MAG: HisA/HisF-related TIM barrel protein [Thermoplasmata archaeon]
MDEIPSVSFKGGYAVVVEGDEYKRLELNGEDNQLAALMENLADYEKIYFVDINGIETDRPQMDLIHKLSTRREIWVDCGVRDMNTLLDLYVSGADKVVISTKTMVDTSFLGKAVEISDSMVFCIDMHGEEVLSPSEEVRNIGMIGLLERAVEVGFDIIIIYNLDQDRLDLSELRNVPEGDYELYVGGTVYINTVESKIKGKILGLREVLRYPTTS